MCFSWLVGENNELISRTNHLKTHMHFDVQTRPQQLGHHGGSNPRQQEGECVSCHLATSISNHSACFHPRVLEEKVRQRLSAAVLLQRRVMSRRLLACTLRV